MRVRAECKLSKFLYYSFLCSFTSVHEQICAKDKTFQVASFHLSWSTSRHSRVDILPCTGEAFYKLLSIVLFAFIYYRLLD